MLKMVDGTGIIGVDMICPLGVSTPQSPNYDRVELEGTGMLVLPNSLDAPLERLELGGKTEQAQDPSPSPEYPQEIKNSGKWNEEKQKYEVDVKISNKNLFDLKRIKNGFVKSTGNGFDIAEDNAYPKSIYLDIIIPLKAGQTLNISGVEQDACRIRVKHDTGNYYLKYTANKDTEIIICFYGGLTDENKKTILIEISDTPTNYEPYKEQTLTLTSDRPITKWDRLVEQGGQIGWLYKGRIEPIPKTGWVLHAQGYFYRGGVFLDSVVNNVPKNEVNLFTHFRLGNPTIADNKDVAWLCVVAPGNTSLRVRLADETITTASEFEQYISDKDIKILYETESTEFAPLPQSEQNAIRALTTYYPTTVITADGGEVDPDIKVTYRKEI